MCILLPEGTAWIRPEASENSFISSTSESHKLYFIYIAVGFEQPLTSLIKTIKDRNMSSMHSTSRPNGPPPHTTRPLSSEMRHTNTSYSPAAVI